MRLATVVTEGARAPTLVAAVGIDGEDWLVDLTKAYASYLWNVEGEQFADDLAHARVQSDMLRLLWGGERSMLAAKLGVDYAQEQLADPRVRAGWQAAATLWPSKSVRFLPPVPRPGAFLNSSAKYESHRLEVVHVDPAFARHKEKPTSPVGRVKRPTAQVGHNEPIVRSRLSDKLDYEAELAVIIGKRCKDVRPEDALDVVAGYTCMNDMSLRDLLVKEGTTMGGIFLAKNYDTAMPNGPYLVTKDEVGDPQNLKIQCRINGNVHQDDTTKSMAFPLSECIAFASQFTLEPGDVISTGTPGGVGFARTPPFFLKPGDVVEVEIERVGLLRNWVVDESDVRGPHTAGVFAAGAL